MVVGIRQNNLPYKDLTDSVTVPFSIGKEEPECHTVTLSTIDDDLDLYQKPIDGAMIYFDITPFEYGG